MSRFAASLFIMTILCPTVMLGMQIQRANLTGIHEQLITLGLQQEHQTDSLTAQWLLEQTTLLQQQKSETSQATLKSLKKSLITGQEVAQRNRSYYDKELSSLSWELGGASLLYDFTSLFSQDYYLLSVSIILKMMAAGTWGAGHIVHKNYDFTIEQAQIMLDFKTADIFAAQTEKIREALPDEQVANLETLVTMRQELNSLEEISRKLTQLLNKN